jgi:MazG family protein
MRRTENRFWFMVHRFMGSGSKVRNAGAAFARLVRLMEILRSREGCPWDRRQTRETLRPYLLEETYEALDAIDRGDAAELAEELGDVMFQCVFQAQVAAEAREFDITHAIEAISRKLIRRHPHVFTSAGAPLSRSSRRRAGLREPDAVLEQWEKLKAKEQADAGAERRLLSGIPRAMPALQRAHEIGTRVATVGFDWPQAADVVDKIDEEARELRAAVAENPERAAEELGDLLFSLANLARKLGVEPEAALRRANDKFTQRFDAVEASLHGEGRSVHETSAADLEKAWQRIKTATATRPAATTGRAQSARAPRRRRSRR